jgi:type IV pilus assembly protein PilM
MASKPRSANRVGLDIGSHSVKVTEVSSASSGKPALVSFGLKKIQALPREAVSASISGLFEELRISAKEVNISLSGNSIIARVVSMPKMSEEEMRSALRFEAEKIIPFDISECVLDFQVISQQSKGRPGSDVLLAAVKRSQVMQKMKIVEEAGLAVRLVDIDALSCANAFMADRPSQTEAKTCALINIGASSMNLCILDGDSVSVVRDVAIGGNNITEAIARKTGLSIPAAEEMKVSVKERASEVADCSKTVIAGLIDEIKLSFGYHENQSGRGVDEIYLSGGSAAAAGLDEAFEEAFGSRPKRWDQFRFMSTDNAGEAAMGPMKSVFAVAAGLALR